MTTRFLPILALACATACTAPNPVAERLDPREVDFADLRVSVALSDGLVSDPPVMTLATSVSAAPVKTALVPTEDRFGTESTPVDGVRVFGIDPAALPALRAVQDGIENATGDGEASVMFATAPCRQTPSSEPGSMAISIAGPPGSRPIWLLPPTQIDPAPCT